MFKEMLEEYNQLKTADEASLNDFSAEVLSYINTEELEKRANKIFGTITKGIVNAAGLGKNKHGKISPSAVAFGVGLPAASVASGRSKVIDQVPFGDKLQGINEGARTIADAPGQHRLPVGMMTPARSMPKVAGTEEVGSDPIKDLILNAGAAVLAGAGAYAGVRGVSALASKTLGSQALSQTMDVAIGQVGREAVRGLTAKRPVAGVVGRTVTQGGKFLESITPRQNIRTDFDSLTGAPGVKDAVKAGAALTGLVAGTALIEDLAVDKAKKGFKSVKQSLASEQEDILEKEATEKLPLLSEAEKRRLFAERMLRPAMTTGIALTTLAGLSQLTGRNLYGGFERVNNTPNKNVTYIDVPTSQLTDGRKKKEVVIKEASVAEAVEDITKALKKDKPASKLEVAKEALNKKIENAPAPIKRVDDILAADSAYTGKKGGSHFLLEEAPFKVVESLAYATPMIGVGLLTGRNLKRAFAPIDDPLKDAPPVEEGHTRIILQEEPKDVL